MYKTIIILLCLLFFLNAEDGETLSARCTACHGPNFEKSALGKSEIIAGWDVDKTYKALQEYKTGTLNLHGMGALMKSQVWKLSDKEIHSLSEYINTLKSYRPTGTAYAQATRNYSPDLLQSPIYSTPTAITSKTNFKHNEKEKKILDDYLSILSSKKVIERQNNDVKGGQKFYVRYLKQAFDGLNGTMFAAEHTKAEWEELFADNAQKFIAEYTERFPKALPILTNPYMLEMIHSVGDFAEVYSCDSGHIPDEACNQTITKYHP